MPGAAVIAARQVALLSWYDRAGRDLPWRRCPSLYGTWIAEMMLQQTTVVSVTGRWKAFLARFPDVTALAAAGESEVLAAWSGLGYYRRARHLHAAARLLAARFGGALPDTLAGWRALPGVGEYASGAIASIGLGLAVPAVDANVRRVLTRWTCADAHGAASLTGATLQALAACHVPTRRPGDWNQALMDLGAGPCRSGVPDCGACPVRSHCAAGLAGTATGVPPPPRRTAAIPVALGCLVLRSAGEVLLMPSQASVVTRLAGRGRPVRADMAGLFAGLLAVPATPWYPRDAANAGPEPRDAASDGRAWRRWLRGLGWRQPSLVVAGSFRHTITSHRLLVQVMVARWPGDLPRPTLDGSVWAAPEAAELPLATLARRAVEIGTNDL